MFFPRQESVIPTGNLQDDSEKVELEVPSYASQGRNSIPHSSTEDRTEETNSIVHHISSSKEY